jgi:hypothetical protein
VKTVYDLYHWSHPDARAEITPGFETETAAAEHAGIPADANWVRVPMDDGWVIDPDPNGRQTEWGIFERRIAENDRDKVGLVLELVFADGQVDGAHHKAWVIDQVARIVAGDEYESLVASYNELGEWDEGIAP